MAKRQKHNYVDNKKFLAEMINYRRSVLQATDFGVERPRVPYYIGDCIMKIATHLSYKPNFINYTFREEMISDGVENCLQYIDNFDPEKSKNPFAYFTQIIYYAFIRRIQKEKKQSHVKNKMIEKQEYLPYITMAGDNTNYNIGGFDPTIMLPDEDVYKPKKKDAKGAPKGLENFMEMDD